VAIVTKHSPDKYKHLWRHGQPGLYSLADLPQAPSIAEHAISTQWWELDQIFKLYAGQFVVVTGIPGHGKSTFVLNILANVAKKKDIRSFVYAPENEQQLMRRLRGIWNNDSTFDIFASRQIFIQSSAENEHDDRPKTLPWVLDMAVRAVEKDGVDIVVIDPWNELERCKPADWLMTDYISECLMLVKQFIRLYRVTVIIVAHPTKAGLEKGHKPGLADIEGSMGWYNKCDNGLIVVRDESKLNTTRVISAKVRESPDAGKVGDCWFFVDPETGIFTPQHGAVT
jgi:twinkle protein